MNTLRVLLIEENPGQSQRVASVLSEANYNVVPADGLEEASEALFGQNFDAVLFGSPVPAAALAEFTATLRAIESAQRGAARTPVLSFSPPITESYSTPGSDPGIDEYLPMQFEAAALAAAVNRLSRAATQPSGTGVGSLAELPVFEPEKFQAQVCHDRDLMIEIIDLFLIERASEVGEMRDAFAGGDYDRLCRVAHTIKGSLGSLH